MEIFRSQNDGKKPPARKPPKYLESARQSALAVKDILEQFHPDGGHWIHQVVDMVEIAVDKGVRQLSQSPEKPPVMKNYRYTEPSKDPGHMAEGKSTKWLA